MTTETIIEILQWLIPTGTLGGLLAWFTNKVIRNTRTVKEVHDTYKEMYENTQGTLLELQNDNKRLYRAVSKLERTISKATTCVHYNVCPLRSELQEQTGDDTNDIRPIRQPAKRKKNGRMARDNPSKQSKPESADGQYL
jgi:hypothetical protein